MTRDFEQCHEQLASIRADLATAQSAIALVERRRGGHAALAASCAIAIVVTHGWYVSAQAPSRIPSTPEEQVFNLYKRVTALEEQLASGAFRGPLKVLDARGRPIAIIGQSSDGTRGITLFAENGRETASLGDTQGGGLLELEGSAGAGIHIKGSGNTELIVGVTDSGGLVQVKAAGKEADLAVATTGPSVGLVIRGGSDKRVQVGYGQEGGGGIRIETENNDAWLSDEELGVSSGQQIAKMTSTYLSVDESGSDDNSQAAIIEPNAVGIYTAGELATGLSTNEGNSIVQVNDSSGEPAATLSSSNGKSFIQVYNAAGQVVAVLTQGARDDGMLQLSNAAGAPTVEAGTLPDGVGCVRTGPMGRAGGVFGLPGSYIVGKKP